MEIRAGHVTHYYNRISVAVLELTRELKVNQTVHILGHTSDFIQKVSSLEINHRKIQSAGPGAEVALKIDEPVRRGDLVYIVEEEVPSHEGM
jgi:hypothetical protein